MSQFQRKIFQKKLKEAEIKLGLSFDEEAAFADDKPTEQSIDRTPEETIEKVDFTFWDKYFTENETFQDEEGNKFNTYYVPPLNNTSPVFVFHHGAGSSGLSFSLLAQELVSQMSDSKDAESSQSICGVFSFDARGHGRSVINDETKDNYSISNFTNDFIWLLKQLIAKKNLHRNSIFLVGHSLGGAILTKAICELNLSQIKGLSMLDIVEDTAINALKGMEIYMGNLPRSFKTLDQAIEWHVKSGIPHNKKSAEISIPSYFKFNSVTKNYQWVLDLNKTSPYWKDWFIGLSKNFVNAPGSKLLILAGTDNLDKDLMIGQMQGKYQLVVFQDSGHFIQEDTPRKTAITLIDFWKRNDKRQTTIKTNWGAN
ncbi:hypothetical protein WICMUC_000653 [Wickerhamomyces mucosus]|uniref:Protein phosphatase methylesterase 1 n=1 Tax=Wickerhamomyces mucosus TaxID=1378264 RepID=A0A9P8TII8_9ASCO|nr:hypothetical protein WICMUC_000653 [Wickerhamomyces mucosus]